MTEAEERMQKCKSAKAQKLKELSNNQLPNTLTHMCHACNRRFITRIGLSSHLRTHRNRT